MLTQQQEIANLIAFFKQHHIAWLGDAGDKNGNLFADYLVQWGDHAKQVIDATPANLAIVYQKLQEANRPFVYYSPEETQYRILEEQNGKAWADSIWQYFPGHGLESTYGNFLTIATFVQHNGWGTETRDNFTRMVGNIRNSQHGRYGQPLEYKMNSRATVESERVRLETEAKAKANTPVRKISEEEKARAVSHIASNDGTDSRSAVRQISPDSELGRHKAMVDAAMKTTERQVAQEQDPTEAYFGQRTTEFIASIPSINDKALVQEHVQNLRERGMNWSRILVNVDNYYNKLKTNRWQSQQRG